MSASIDREEETLLHGMPSYLMRRLAVLSWTDSHGDHLARIEGRTVVGAADGAGIQIPDDRTLSRLHAELEPRDDGLWVRDLGSRNGSYLDGLFIQCARVPNGGRISLGSTIFKVRYEEGAPELDIWPQRHFGPLLGQSLAMRELFASLARISPLASSVLIHGETGTGKELVARALHEASPRKDGPFIIVDCAALPEHLLDAELFGHTKGAFTGAVSQREGAIESADGGTVFLDEIGELPMSMQPKLLRALEQRTVRRIGESVHRKVDVRFVSATHRDLLTMVNAGEFREDLYFRLAVVPVVVPPLRQRVEDVAMLIEHFLTLNGHKGSISDEVMREVLSRPWRGNVRELRNFVERALALGPAEALEMTRPRLDATAEHARAGASAPPLAPSLAAPPIVVPPAPVGVSADGVDVSFEQAFKNFREQWVDTGEREYVRRLLERHDRNVQAAATAAGVDRTYIYRLIRKHGL